MPTEIERKFLIAGDFRSEIIRSFPIKQGYLCSDPARTVRVRLKGDRAFLTIKGSSNSSGLSRYEWEKEIPVAEAEELLLLCEPEIIEKTRHLISFHSFVYEVDEFFGANQGLILSEIELPTEETLFEKPLWLGQEVTGNIRFYNSYLSKHPFSTWK
jgi:adenylate cyclase